MKKLISTTLALLITTGSSSLALATTDALSPLLGEIKWVGFNFAPRGWATCDGQLLPINQNQALFSLLGTTYGGDGRTSFALPDMRGRLMVHEGTGAGLTPKALGQKSGTEQHTLTAAELPSHSHTIKATSNTGNSTLPDSAVMASQRRSKYFSDQPPSVVMDPTTISPTGASQSHENMAPTNTLTCIISLTGLFPSRS